MDAPSFATTFEFAGYSVRFSPFEERLAVASSQHFGIVGNGRLFIFDVAPDGLLVPLRQFDARDGLYDVVWSEENENQLVACSGDGSIKLWDIYSSESYPLQSYEEHAKEVQSVDWNLVDKKTFVSGSWDECVKLWSPAHAQSISTWKEHGRGVYCVSWCPVRPQVFASASGDHTLKIWNTGVLTCDWNKYNEFILVSGSVDKTMKIWDIRNPNRELGVLRGHDYAIRRLKCSPHKESVILSCSYDLSLMLWNTALDNPLVHRYDHHTEFVVGVDFNIFREGEMASCSWDECVVVWHESEHPSPTGQTPNRRTP